MARTGVDYQIFIFTNIKANNVGINGKEMSKRKIPSSKSARKRFNRTYLIVKV